jgi:hypothetical protein
MEPSDVRAKALKSFQTRRCSSASATSLLVRLLRQVPPSKASMGVVTEAYDSLTEADASPLTMILTETWSWLLPAAMSPWQSRSRDQIQANRVPTSRFLCS